MLFELNAPSIPDNLDVVIIGAGPSGSIAASLLHQQGKKVLVLEKQFFPRFSIGESLLPCCMQVIEEANMLDAVNNAGFQFKNGAAFQYGDRYTTFDFDDKFTTGPSTTFQVERAKFDKLLADTAQAQGVDIRFGQTVEQVDLSATPRLHVRNEQGKTYEVNAQYILDASGFGRVLPRLLDLERPSSLPTRSAIFTHVEDNITDANFDRNKILISVNPNDPSIWYWLIPFSNGRCSLGVVAEPEKLAQQGDDFNTQLLNMVEQEPSLHKLLKNSKILNNCNELKGYSANISTLATDKFALLGNAGEFLDPVFSSGVTIAMQSASFAVKSLIKQLNGESVDWQQDYAAPLMQGVNTFRTYVQAWYDTHFQQVIFHQDSNPKIKQMICSILAGYAWDMNNPYVSQSDRRLRTLVELCQETALNPV
ncbi:NAD(P)/FAD-dependent oxidoreductase [Shewanella surugensis]|uniref:Tryptophan 7-halogenase n=1 Tax=Shewanella surugensis TaxID=212020 RepID=A0ABT0LA55_9GAMM|nr:NAD(P)/FAD-dependent oxidoreductase [Shewanella surugensis]MCL1124594.1 tryptophan 7-halogenase [Shewanella surugensis]